MRSDVYLKKWCRGNVKKRESSDEYDVNDFGGPQICPILVLPTGRAPDPDRLPFRNMEWRGESDVTA